MIWVGRQAYTSGISEQRDVRSNTYSLVGYCSLNRCVGRVICRHRIQSTNGLGCSALDFLAGNYHWKEKRSCLFSRLIEQRESNSDLILRVEGLTASYPINEI